MKLMTMSEREWQWLRKRARCLYCEDSIGIALHEDDGTIAAVVVMDSWSNSSCQVHMAIGNPMALRHGLLEAVTDFVFNERGRSVMIGLVPANNAKALKLNKHIGFTQVFSLEDGYDKGVDYVVMQMREADSRWHTPENSNGR
jgi:hypothetical protein